MGKRQPDPTGKRGLALAAADLAVRAAEQANTEMDRAVWFAHEQGSSLREISEATGIPTMTVKRLVDRKPDDLPG